LSEGFASGVCSMILISSALTRKIGPFLKNIFYFYFVNTENENTEVGSN